MRLWLEHVGAAGVLAIALIAAQSAATAVEKSGEGAQRCLSITDNTARLSCYDREVLKLVPPTFSGRLSATTDSFHVERKLRLRYHSDGAIFVLYLKSADGEVVQNLHIGGGGEATYLIDQPGTYFLDVNGSESWRIWLEPDRFQITN